MGKPTKAQVEARTLEIVRIRLYGAEIWDVREYVREQEQTAGSPWQLADGQKPLSDSQLWRYVARADKQIAESCRASRKKLLRRHLAQRRNIFGKAMSAGDYRAALAAARDEAELLGLYPSKAVSVRGNVGGVITLQVLEELVVRQTPPALEHVPEANTHVNGSPHTAAGVAPAQAGQAAPGAAGVPQE
jgi:hypothetical protein